MSNLQEMKAAGITPDLACYNSLLRACSFAGDAVRAMDVLKKMTDDGIQPNDSSYREALKAAAKEGRSDIADQIWDEAMVTRKSPYDYRFATKPLDFESLVNAYWKDVQSTTNHTARLEGNRKILAAYERVMNQSQDRGMDRILSTEIEQNQLLMLKILRAAVSIVMVARRDEGADDIRERVKARAVAIDIAGLHVMRSLDPAIDGKTKKAFGLARDWIIEQ